MLNITVCSTIEWGGHLCIRIDRNIFGTIVVTGSDCVGDRTNDIYYR